MENEIKVNEYIRTKDGYIGKYVKDGLRKGTIEVEDNMVNWIVDSSNILKRRKNLIDLIQCGDYVNGKEVIMDLQKSKEWYKSKDNFITCKDYTFEENEIKEIVTKEQMESISYKVTKM